jgi:hypothetical protein
MQHKVIFVSEIDFSFLQLGVSPSKLKFSVRHATHEIASYYVTHAFLQFSRISSKMENSAVSGARRAQMDGA